MPARSSSRRRSDSVLGGTPVTACLNSLNLTAPELDAHRIVMAWRRSRRSAARRTSSGTGLQLRQRTVRRRLRLERQVEYLVHGHDRVERHLLADVLGDVVQVAAVAL